MSLENPTEAELSVENGSPLPDGYGDNRLVILARDPLCFFAYWEVSHDCAEKARQQFGADVWERGVLVLRVYDVTGSEQNAPFFDIEVQRFAHDWYVHLSQGGRSIIAEIGLRLPDGSFIALVRSNKIMLPYGRVSELTDSQWMAVTGAEMEQKKWEQYIGIAGGPGSARGSADVAKGMAQRWEFLKSVFSGSSSASSSRPWPVPSGADAEGKR